MMKRPVVASKDKLTHRLTPAAVRWALAEIDAGRSHTACEPYAAGQ